MRTQDQQCKISVKKTDYPWCSSFKKHSDHLLLFKLFVVPNRKYYSDESSEEKELNS